MSDEILGQICMPEPARPAVEPEDACRCSLPASTPDEAAQFLEVIGTGGSLGSGLRLSALGVSIPSVRGEYHRRVQSLVLEVQGRRAAGQLPREIASWVVGERSRISREMRRRTGPGARALFEIRDWAEYGPGGRTFRNLESRYMARGFSGDRLADALVRGATRPNADVSAAALKGARYLKYGGRVIVVLSVATTAHALLTAPPGELERVVLEEGGGFLGGSVGTSFGVAACLVFGVVSGGWGLLACGVVGGTAGGAAGAFAGNKLYYSRNKALDRRVDETGIVDSTDLIPIMPTEMCLGP